MSLYKIDSVNHVNPERPLNEVIVDLCRKLADFQVLTMKINNECLDLRREVENLKLRC